MAIQTLALLMWKSPKKTHITVSTPAGNTTTPIPSQQVKDSAGALFPPNSSTASSTPNYVVSTPQGLPALLTKPHNNDTVTSYTVWDNNGSEPQRIFAAKGDSLKAWREAGAVPAAKPQPNRQQSPETQLFA